MKFHGKDVRRGAALYFLKTLLVYAFDQGSKIVARNAMKEGDSIPVALNFFYITLVHNTGAAFGIMKDRPYFFAVIAAGFSLVIAYLLLTGRDVLSHREKTALSLILGGALGNLTDRVRFGYVIDFIDLKIWPVFNIADSAITIGAAMLAVFLITGSRRKKCTE